MKTVTVKTSGLKGAALDWAVAKATGTQWSHPSSSWAQGGPLIDKYDIALNGGESESGARIIYATLRSVPKDAPYCCSNGPTRLIAAMRAIVAAELGDTIEIPDSLVTPL